MAAEEVVAADSCTEALVDSRSYHTNLRNFRAFEGYPGQECVADLHTDFVVKRDFVADHTAGWELEGHRT